MQNLFICFRLSFDEHAFDDLMFNNYESNDPKSNDDEWFENEELNGQDFSNEFFEGKLNDPNLNPGFSIEAFRQDQLDLHNHYRSLHGAPPMARDDEYVN